MGQFRRDQAALVVESVLLLKFPSLFALCYRKAGIVPRIEPASLPKRARDHQRLVSAEIERKE